MLGWLWRKIFPDKPKRQGQISPEETQALMLGAFHTIMSSFDTSDPYNDERQCAALIMKEFMDSHNYLLSKKELVKAAKLANHYAKQVMAGKWI